MQEMPDSLRQRRIEAQDYRESTSRLQTGFLAQEVEQVCKKLNFDFSGLHVPESPLDNYSLAYGSFVPLLVKAVQEQQSIIDNQAGRMTALETKEAQMQAQLEAQPAQLRQIQVMLMRARLGSGN
jgi:hypothetical protein